MKRESQEERQQAAPTHAQGRALSWWMWLKTTMMPSREYLANQLAPYPLPTKDGGVLRTIGDVRAYMLALPKNRQLRAHWQHASRLFLEEANVASVTRQVHLALSMDGKLDIGEFGRMSDARRWRRNTP